MPPHAVGLTVVGAPLRCVVAAEQVAPGRASLVNRPHHVHQARIGGAKDIAHCAESAPPRTIAFVPDPAGSPRPQWRHSHRRRTLGGAIISAAAPARPHGLCIRNLPDLNDSAGALHPATGEACGAWWSDAGSSKEFTTEPRPQPRRCVADCNDDGDDVIPDVTLSSRSLRNRARTG